MKNPMDLSTIKRKLDTGQYQEPWQYVDDVWLMFNNAWLYNRKTSRVYKFCTKLAEVFEQEIDPVMQSLGYCCGRKVRVCLGGGAEALPPRPAASPQAGISPCHCQPPGQPSSEVPMLGGRGGFMELCLGTKGI